MKIYNTKPCVVGIGEALLDCFNDGTQRLGGAPLIFTYHAAKTYCKGVIVSAIGNDKEGKTIKEGISNMELTDEYVYPVDKFSGTVEVDDSDPNNPQYDIKTNVAWAAIPDSDDLIELAKNTNAVYFGPLASYCGKYISKVTIDKFLDNVPKGCWKIFDVNLRHNLDKNGNHTIGLFDDKLIREYVKKCNILKVNIEELDYVCQIYGISGNDRNKSKGEKLMELDGCSHIEILLLTMGEDGSTIYWRNESKLIVSQSVRISVQLKNTVGAGDAMAGAFIGEILRGKEITEAHYAAAQRSAHVCKTGVSMPPITRTDLFISYSRRDENVVVFFCNKFRERGFTVWRDKNMIDYGEEFMGKINEAIEKCKIFVYFSSKDANKSKYVKREIRTAKNYRKTIIPIVLDNTPFPKGVRSKLNNLNHYNDFTLTDLTEQLQDLYNNV